METVPGEEKDRTVQERDCWRLDGVGIWNRADSDGRRQQRIGLGFGRSSEELLGGKWVPGGRRGWTDQILTNTSSGDVGTRKWERIQY